MKIRNTKLKEWYPMVVNEIIDELAYKLLEYMKQKHIKIDDAVDSKGKILSYLDNRERCISPVPRSIVLSHELSEKIKSNRASVRTNFDENNEVLDAYDYIVEKLKLGKDVTYNLSGKLFDSREKYKDIMLNAWKIKHIHLSKIDVNSKRGMKKNRSDYLLFCIVTADTVYCIDILRHPESENFFCINLMKIIKSNNWMNIIGFESEENYIAGSLKPIIEKDEDLTQLYVDNKINCAFEFDGKMYMSLDGITCTGDRSSNVIFLQRFIRNIEKILKDTDKFIGIEQFTILKDGVVEFCVMIEREGEPVLYKGNI